MRNIDQLVADRAENTKRFDTEVWEFMERVDVERSGGSRLQHLAHDALLRRLEQIELNIQFLDDGVSGYENCDHNDGWTSPWWWYRARHWTLLEIRRRGIVPIPSRTLAPMPALGPNFKGVFAGGRELLVRISRREWLTATLMQGKLRLSPAAAYLNSNLNAARADDEMGKSYVRPASALQIRTVEGKVIKPIGEVKFTQQRRVEVAGSFVDRPYWMMSFSSDLDPRLFDEFPSDEPLEDAVLIIFDVKRFCTRAFPALSRAAPGSICETVRNSYFDPYFPPDQLSAIRSKLMAYAYQREVRLVLDPGAMTFFEKSQVLEAEIGSIADIAGVYDRLGNKIAGTGPDSFLAP